MADRIKVVGKVGMRLPTEKVLALLEFRWSCPYLVASQPPEAM
jgi:hypothetical protein